MPRFSMMNPHDQSPERVSAVAATHILYPQRLTVEMQAQLVQSYMVLHSQQTSVRRRLSLSDASPSPTSTPERSPSRRSSLDSPSRHPSFTRTMSSPSQSRPRSPRSPYQRRPSIPSIPEEPQNDVPCVHPDEDKLFDINKRIRSTLTDLFNCDSVKHDDRMRAWVHSRLMDVQQTLDEQKRSRASEGTATQADAVSFHSEDELPRKLSM